MKRLWNRYTKWLTVLACCACAVAAVYILPLIAHLILDIIIIGGNIPKPMPFESSVWKATEATYSIESIRLRMVDDLLKTHPLVGLTRAEVESLIGPADDTEYFSNFDMVYFLGPERHPFAVDSEWLLISLDSNGRVTEAVLGRD